MKEGVKYGSRLPFKTFGLYTWTHTVDAKTPFQVMQDF